MFSPDLTEELQPLLNSATGGDCCFPGCLLLVGLLMVIIAGKSITANVAVGKHGETALNAVLKVDLGFKIAVQEG